MVGLPGLEPGTSVLSGPRSNHLSYRPSDARHSHWSTAKERRERTPPANPAETPIHLRMPPRPRPRRGSRSDGLPRKEVIQPHLPVRLPCYDFVPITGLALDGWPPEGSPRRLQAPPAFMT